MIAYADKLKDPRWQKKRLEVMGAAKFKCQLCADDKRTLAVHHPKYENGKEPWDYDNLICLCEKCHTRFHANDNEAWIAKLLDAGENAFSHFATMLSMGRLDILKDSLDWYTLYFVAMRKENREIPSDLAPEEMDKILKKHGLYKGMFLIS